MIPSNTTSPCLSWQGDAFSVIDQYFSSSTAVKSV